MDFQPTERQSHWRDRVRDFIEKEVRPAVPTTRSSMTCSVGSISPTGAITRAFWIFS